jgi:hypothetical protein
MGRDRDTTNQNLVQNLEVKNAWLDLILGSQIGWAPTLNELQSSSQALSSYQEHAFRALGFWAQSLMSMPHLLQSKASIDRHQFKLSCWLYLLLGALVSSNPETRQTLNTILDLAQQVPNNATSSTTGKVPLFYLCHEAWHPHDIKNHDSIESMVKAGQLAFAVSGHANLTGSQSLQAWWEKDSPVGLLKPATRPAATATSSSSSASASASSLPTLSHNPFERQNWAQIFLKIWKVMFYGYALDLVAGGALLVHEDYHNTWRQMSYTGLIPSMCFPS